MWRRTLAIAALAALLGAAQSALPGAAQAFCITNATARARVFVAVALDAPGAAPFRGWLAPDERVCADAGADEAASRISFYAFAGEDSIEGCDAPGFAGDEVRLLRFEEFDRCEWDFARPTPAPAPEPDP